MTPEARDWPPAVLGPTEAAPVGVVVGAEPVTPLTRCKRVFVSYAHDDLAHKMSVKALCDLLARSGVDVQVDQSACHDRRDWQRWVTTEIVRADFVIVVASPVYRAASDYTLAEDSHRGVQSEFLLLAELLRRDRHMWTRKILPVVLPGRRDEEIPLVFQPLSADHYLVSSFTSEGARSLLNLLRGSPP